VVNLNLNGTFPYSLYPEGDLDFIQLSAESDCKNSKSSMYIPACLTISFLNNKSVTDVNKRLKIASFLYNIDLETFSVLHDCASDLCCGLENADEDEVERLISEMQAKGEDWTSTTLYYPYTALENFTCEPEMKFYLSKLLNGFAGIVDEDMKRLDEEALNFRLGELDKHVEFHFFGKDHNFDSNQLLEMLLPEISIRENKWFPFHKRIYLQCAFEKVARFVKDDTEFFKILPMIFDCITQQEYSKVIQDIHRLELNASSSDIANACLNGSFEFYSMDSIVACVEIKKQIKNHFWDGFVSQLFNVLIDDYRIIEQLNLLSNQVKNRSNSSELLSLFINSKAVDQNKLNAVGHKYTLYDCSLKNKIPSFQPQAKLLQELLDEVLCSVPAVKYREQIVKFLFGMFLNIYPEQAKEWFKARIEVDDLEKRNILLEIMYECDDNAEKYFSLFLHERRFTNLGTELGMRVYLNAKVEKMCQVIDLHQVKKIKWAFPSYCVIKELSHYVGVYSFLHKNQPVAIIFDSLNNFSNVTILLDLLPERFEKIILGDYVTENSLYDMQADRCNCAIFCLEVGKQLLKYPEISEEIVKKRVLAEGVGVYSLNISDLPWRLYLGVQSMTKLKSFAQLLSTSDRDHFLKKASKYIRIDGFGKEVNNRINDKSRKVEKAVVESLFQMPNTQMLNTQMQSLFKITD